jgi:dimethylsulfone monooxygenase
MFVSGHGHDGVDLFGSPQLDHDTWYEYATEWLDIVRRLWASETGTFDYSGTFFRLQGAASRPKPIQQPYPAIMNAGTSPAGQRWAAQHADMAFTAVAPGNLEKAQERISTLRALAQGYGRQVQVWMTSSVACRPTDQEAEDYVDYVSIERGDISSAGMLWGMPGLAAQIDQLPPHEAAAKKREMVFSSFRMQPLVGSPTRIAEQIIALSRAGLDGLNLTFVNYQDELRRFVTAVLPLLEEAGLRERFAREDGEVAELRPHLAANSS